MVAAVQGFWSPLLQLEDAEAHQQARLSTLLAPFWAQEMAAPALKAEESEMTEAAEKADFDPTCTPPVRVVRLLHPDQATGTSEAEYCANVGVGLSFDRDIGFSTCVWESQTLFCLTVTLSSLA
ncbi:unnamed protein product [Effrenium voratum]|nr:unnamed protein product [Effrenium voratum]